MSSVLIVGSLAFDSIKTPAGEVSMVMGGSASYASFAASYFAPAVRLVGIVGADFGTDNINMFKTKKIEIEGIEISREGKTFHWQGEYDGDMNEAKTLSTCVNVFEKYKPVLSELNKTSKFVFLANIDPGLQLHVLDQLKKPRLVVCDTMNFWIETQPELLFEVLSRSDIILMNDQEARLLVKETNLNRAANRILNLGKARWVIIKKGVHGAVLYSKDAQFVVPAFPTAMLVDPTGAGDTFAGGLVGWLSSRKRIQETAVRQACLIGTALASYTIEDFSVRKLYHLDYNKIKERVDVLQRMLKCPPITISHQ